MTEDVAARGRAVEVLESDVDKKEEGFVLRAL